MFSRGYGVSREHRKPKRETGSKKQHIRNWMHSRKKKNEANLFTVMMSSGDSSPPVPQASISSTGFDTLDDAKLVKTATATKASKPADTDTEAIEVVPIVHTTLSTPQPKPKIERNGIDVDIKTAPRQTETDDSCLINCIYYTQQCCECRII